MRSKILFKLAIVLDIVTWRLAPDRQSWA